MNLVSTSLPLIVCVRVCLGRKRLHHAYIICIIIEEHETEGGEHVVGLKVKEKEVEEEAPGNHRCKCFSVDFPPGLVHLDTESQSTPGQTWILIKNLLANRKTSKL